MSAVATSHSTSHRAATHRAHTHQAKKTTPGDKTLKVLNQIDADLKKILKQLKAGASEKPNTGDIANALDKLNTQLTEALNALKGGGTPNGNIADLLSKLGDTIKQLVAAIQNNVTPQTSDSGSASGSSGSTGSTSNNTSDSSNSAGDSDTSTSKSALKKPSWMKDETWDALDDKQKSNIVAQDEQESHSMAMNMATFALQQKAQEDARLAETMSQLSRTYADAALNSVRNIRA